jgi:hypothetical protein
VEETLNALLEAEADQLCNAKRYERSEARRDTRAGHYERKLQTKASKVRLKVPSRNRDTAPQSRPWSARRDGIGHSARAVATLCSAVQSAAPLFGRWRPAGSLSALRTDGLSEIARAVGVSSPPSYCSR